MSLDETEAAAVLRAVLDDHEHPRPVKRERRATEPMATGRDLSRARSPGFAGACPCEAGSMIRGAVGRYLRHSDTIRRILSDDEPHPVGAMSLVILDRGPPFVADTDADAQSDARALADITVAAARHLRRFGIAPKLVPCSDSQFGNLDSRSGRMAREAPTILDGLAPDFECEGEPHTDAALDPDPRERLFPGGRPTGRANALVHANPDAAGVARNLPKSAAGGLEVGAVPMGMGDRAHIATPSVTVRGLLDIAALAGTPMAAHG